MMIKCKIMRCVITDLNLFKSAVDSRCTHYICMRALLMRVVFYDILCKLMVLTVKILGILTDALTQNIFIGFDGILV